MWEAMEVGAEKKNRRVLPLAASILNKHTHRPAVEKASLAQARGRVTG